MNWTRAVPLFHPWIALSDQFHRYQMLATNHAARLAAIHAHAAETFLQLGVEQLRTTQAFGLLTAETFASGRHEALARTAASRFSEDWDALNDLNREFSEAFQRLAQEDVVSLAEAARLRDAMART